MVDCQFRVYLRVVSRVTVVRMRTLSSFSTLWTIFFQFLCLSHDAEQYKDIVVAMGVAIGSKMIEWWPSGCRVEAMVACKKGRLRGADVIRDCAVLLTGE